MRRQCAEMRLDANCSGRELRLTPYLGCSETFRTPVDMSVDAVHPSKCSSRRSLRGEGLRHVFALAKPMNASCIALALTLVLGVFSHSTVEAAGTPETASWIMIDVAGDVARPGAVALRPQRATADRALELLGGVKAEGYRFATMVLREREAAIEGECIPVADRHAALMLADDSGLRVGNAWAADLISGRLQRVPIETGVFGRLGTDQAPPRLASGDVLVVPRQTNVVYVAQSDGQVSALAHQPTLTVDAYLTQAGLRRADVRDYALHYPDASQVSPATFEAWRNEPRMVPPGSLMAPAIDCLPVP